MVLTDTAIRSAKPREKPYKMGDSGGLFLLVQPSGGRLWRFKYRVDGREKKLAIGTYPDVTLAEARRKRDEARQQLAEGRDPSMEKRRRQARAAVDSGNTFALIAREYVDKCCRDGRRPWAPATKAKNEYLLDQLYPMIGTLPVGDIEPVDVLAAVRRIEAKGNLETARRALQIAGSVCRYAIATARLGSDPTRDLRGALAAPAVQHRASIIEPVRVGELMRAIEGYEGHVHTKVALTLLPHVFVRPGELRQAEWQEFDLEAAVWMIPAERTKMRKPHAVPLSKQSLALIEQVRALTSRITGYVFPSIRTTARPMSENTLNAALRRLGYSKDEVTSHGFRSTASTLLNESGRWSADAIERALAHGHEDKVRGIYHRGEHWQERVAMAQWWSDHLDKLRDGAEVLPFPGRQAG
ncbi:MAG: integrase [Citromicrobium sp.]|nr:integrase [Citromicrobium sp.]MAO95795.1 integrase [Citromicrobium sp.]MBT46296.1 integrase [Citromicrobium sp.]|tara:strand:+ start:3773 stop:5008 length:1236 start_codon:yes stop_codon:yes gene_type:complete